jgi:hypothetical protein
MKVRDLSVRGGAALHVPSGGIIEPIVHADKGDKETY